MYTYIKFIDIYFYLYFRVDTYIRNIHIDVYTYTLIINRNKILYKIKYYKKYVIIINILRGK